MGKARYFGYIDGYTDNIQKFIYIYISYLCKTRWTKLKIHVPLKDQNIALLKVWKENNI